MSKAPASVKKKKCLKNNSPLYSSLLFTGKRGSNIANSTQEDTAQHPPPCCLRTDNQVSDVDTIPQTVRQQICRFSALLTHFYPRHFVLPSFVYPSSTLARSSPNLRYLVHSSSAAATAVPILTPTEDDLMSSSLPPPASHADRRIKKGVSSCEFR